MIYKNTIKILFSNFELVWKTVLYYIMNFIIIAGLTYLCLQPCIHLLYTSGIISDAVNIYTDFISNLNLTQFFTDIGKLFESGWNLMVDNISQLWLPFTGLAIVLIFLRSVINGLTIMPKCNALHYYMGSMNKHGFLDSFRDCFWKSLKAQLSQFIVFLPINAIFLILFILELQLFKFSFVLGVFAIILIIVSFTLLYSLKITLFSGWIPTMVVLNFGVFKSLKANIKNVCRIFPKVFGGAIGIFITIFLINLIIVPFTFLVGLILTIPASYLIYSTYGMVSVYEGQGMRYYVDVYNVITPQKREIRDKLKEMKYIV